MWGIFFGDFPGVPLSAAGVVNGGGEAPFSAPPDSAAAAAAEGYDTPVFATKRQRKNNKRAMARKKVYQARAAAGDGEAPTAPPVPTFSTPPHLKKFRRVGRNRIRRRVGVSGRKNKHRGCCGWRDLGWRGKCVRRRLKRRGSSGAVRRKRCGDGIRCEQKFTFNVTEENYRSFRDQMRGGGPLRGGKKAVSSK